MLLIHSTWNNDDEEFGEYYITTDYFIEDLCEIHQIFFYEINRQKNTDTNGED